MFRSPATRHLCLGALLCASPASPLAAQPDDGPSVYDEALGYSLRGDTARARAGFARAAQLLPHEATPLIFVGMLEKMSGNVPASIEAYREALARLAHPQTLPHSDSINVRRNAVTGLMSAGVALFRAEDMAGAERTFALVAATDPGHRDARYNRAVALYRLQQWAALGPAARQLLELDPLNYLGWTMLFSAERELSNAARASGNAQVEAAARARAMEAFERMDHLPVQLEVAGFAADSGRVLVQGRMTGAAAPAGSAVPLVFELLDGGRVVATVEHAVTAPAKDATANFEVRGVLNPGATGATSVRYRLR